MMMMMMIEMQLGEGYSKSNLFIQPHLQSPNCLLSFQTWQTNKYAHLSINTYGGHARTHARRGPLLILQVKSGKNCKRCICILICSQSGIVFAVAVKLPAVCASSPFIELPWKTGPKFKCECYRRAHRWDLLSVLFSSLLFLSVSAFSPSINSSFFPNNSPVFSMISPYFSSTLLFHHSSYCFSTCLSSPHPAHSSLSGGWKPFGFHQHDSPPLKGCASVGLCLHRIQPLHKLMPPFFPPSHLPSVHQAAHLP